MVIVLPDTTYGLDSVIEKLDSGYNIMAVVETLKNTELEVVIPRFNGESTSQVHLVTHLLSVRLPGLFIKICKAFVGSWSTFQDTKNIMFIV